MRRRFNHNLHLIQNDEQTVVASLQTTGVAVEIWITLTSPPTWGVRVREGGKTFSLPAPRKA